MAFDSYESKARQLANKDDLPGQETLIRGAIADGQLTSIGLTYRNLFRVKHDPHYLYGLLRTQYSYLDFGRYAHKGLLKDFGLANFQEFESSLKTIPGKLVSPYALAAYYQYVAKFREKGMARPTEQSEWVTVKVNGKPQKIEITQTTADEPKEKRLTELFNRMWSADKTNPMVLEIAAERSIGDPERSYAFMKKAYEAGGKEFFPETALFHLYTMAKKINRGDLAQAHQSELLSWLRAHKDSMWTRYFYCEHSDFPR